MTELTNYRPRRSAFGHQVDALRAGWKRPGFGYLLEMGLGKSRVLIDNFCLLHEAGLCDGLLIVASKNVYTNWTRQNDEKPGELQQWMWDGIRETCMTYTWVAGRSGRDAGTHAALVGVTPPGARVLVVNVESLSLMRDAYELCMRFLRSQNCMIVVDESTLMKNPSSLRTKALTKLSKFAAYRRILSGSPMTRSPTDLFPQFEFLEPGSLGCRSFYTFRERYCVLKEIYVGSRTIKTEVGTRNMDELSERLTRHSYRARKKDCLDLPDKIYERREVELTPEQKKLYSEMRQHAMVLTADGSEATTNIVMTQLMRMHQIVCGHLKTDDGKVMWLPENRSAVLMETISDSDENTVIWCKYQADVQNVVRLLKGEYGEDSIAQWHGDVPMGLREAGELDFQAGRRRFMVATQPSGARGRTWTNGRLNIYYSNHESLELRQQSEDRTHRIGQTGAVLYVDIVVPGTVDESIIKALRSNNELVRLVLRDGPAKWI